MLRLAQDSLHMTTHEECNTTMPASTLSQQKREKRSASLVTTLDLE
jgi:hypothetical protein